MNRAHDPRFTFAPVAPDVPGLARLFAQDSYRFQFGMRRGGPEWFEISRSSAPALEERRHWIATTPADCVVWLPDAASLFDETRHLLIGLSAEDCEQPPSVTACTALGGRWEPEFLLLRPDGANDFRLVGGCACFP